VIWPDIRTLPILKQPNANKPTVKPQFKSNLREIIPATKWVFNDKGEVTLISHSSIVNNIDSTSVSCWKP